jgi:DNA-binding beta-propeller fold protein YncE
MSAPSPVKTPSSRRGHTWGFIAIATVLIAAWGTAFFANGGGILLGFGAETLTDEDIASLLPKRAPAIAMGDQAPELDGGTAWINSAGPIRMADLKGRVVLLDFWTLCCINCIHTIPDLAKLEAKYPGVLVIIGVHTPKFDNEKETESIRKAILRYEVAHPVVNDANQAIWRRYGVNSWPTLVLIDPEGKIYKVGSGEGLYNVLDAEIGKLVKTYRAKKMLEEKPLRFELARNSETGASPLFFPGKVLADQKSNRLFIADSTHHRIVITDLDGKKIAIAGTGTSGFKDGAFDQATFSDPQGMALGDGVLYVADRKNHAIRQLDLGKLTVQTIAGIGKQDRNGRAQGGPARETGLNSPWDLLLQDNKLFIAMAGHHQIWTLDLQKNRVEPFAGDGRENIGDGSPREAHFAQPSGLATDGKTLWVADSETSSIRSLPIQGGGMVKTLVGLGLFDFGDVEGVGKQVRLQHALGVAYKDGKLYIADTYNSKIKILDPATRTCSTFVGEGGGKTGSSTFSEPGGLSFAGDKLYVADTNGHRIRVVDLTTRAVTTLTLQGVEAPKLPEVKGEQ